MLYVIIAIVNILFSIIATFLITINIIPSLSTPSDSDHFCIEQKTTVEIFEGGSRCMDANTEVFLSVSSRIPVRYFEVRNSYTDV
jgi:hypothetical protein